MFLQIFSIKKKLGRFIKKLIDKGWIEVGIICIGMLILLETASWVASSFPICFGESMGIICALGTLIIGVSIIMVIQGIVYVLRNKYFIEKKNKNAKPNKKE